MPDIRPSFWWQTAMIFGLMGVAFLPFPFHVFTLPAQVSDAIFGPLTTWAEVAIWGQPTDFGISSDSRGLVVLMSILFVLSAIFTAIIRWQGWHVTEFNALIYSFVCSYIALILLKYGFGKITKGQFFMPEPNTLYTPFGYMPKDLLYWSVIGLSRPYNIATGLAEVFAALLIIRRRTRVFGLGISALLMSHIVLLNLCFDVSVKTFSILLLGLHVTALWPQITAISRFFVGTEASQLAPQPTSRLLHGVPWRYLSLKTFAVCCFFIEALYPQLHGRPFNDDAAPRPPLHGAYAVLPPSPNHQKIFFHRDGYLIFQKHNGTFADYKISLDTISKNIHITDYQRHHYALQYQHNRDTLRIFGILGSENIDLKALPLPWHQLPAVTSY